MLWLALYFPRLALEVFTPESLAVVVERERVLSADACAQEAGVEEGMRLSSALGLAPGLHVHARDPAREAAAMHTLCCWAGNYTPQLCADPPDCLLLEVEGCARLFGGHERLRNQALDALRDQGWSVQAALAPTPRAARWLALADSDAFLVEKSGLTEQLATLPVEVLRREERDMQLLAAIGARRLGDVMRLPRAGITRRFGVDFTTQLEQALGELPDLRRSFVFPHRFQQRIELPVPVSHTQALLFVGKRLLGALAGWLSARLCGVRECVFSLEHAEHPATRIALGFSEAIRDVVRMERVLRERLERIALIAPVEYVSLAADDPEVLPGETATMFGDAASTALLPVIERLRARLGEDAVTGLQVVHAHRPECASTWPTQPQAAPISANITHPRWLLPQPQVLPEVKGGPYRAGPLKLLAGPERIESGWWDEGEELAPGEVRRDYFIALTQAGEFLWIYRDAQGWFLHGIFA